RQFELFLDSYPNHPKAGKARVLKALADVRQFALGAAPSWTNALQAAQKMASLSKEPAYQDESTELAELILKAADGLADRARQAGDRESLDQAVAALNLFKKVAGKAADPMLGKSRVPARLAQAREAVRKVKGRAERLAEMAAALKWSSAAEVYAAGDALVGEYTDLAADKEVVKRLTTANKLIMDGVKFDDSRRPADVEPPPEPVGPPTSLVL